jgi:leucyl/phenylalanyl-tRNA--protein transferase
MPVFLLTDELIFPPPHLARNDGLLAVGGDLSVDRLLLAYREGIFPWFIRRDPILWWSPDPRLVLFPEEIKVSKSLEKTVRQCVFHVTIDTVFHQVVTECARVRLQKKEGTWITREMIGAYGELHNLGYAHSVEVWLKGQLAGGLYGVSLGKCFFGESMFTRVSNASKVALVTLVDYLREKSFDMIDCQITTEHLKRFGAREVPRDLFLTLLKKSLEAPTLRGQWTFRP